MEGKERLIMRLHYLGPTIEPIDIIKPIEISKNSKYPTVRTL
jgi:hypothetical protein